MGYLEASLKTLQFDIVATWINTNELEQNISQFQSLTSCIAKWFAAMFTWQNFHQACLSRKSHFNILLPKKASTRQLTPLMALKKIWGSCFKHGCSTTSWGIPLELRNCSWNFGVVLTIAGLLRSTGLLETHRPQIHGLCKKLTDTNKLKLVRIYIMCDYAMACIEWNHFSYIKYHQQWDDDRAALFGNYSVSLFYILW